MLDRDELEIAWHMTRNRSDCAGIDGITTNLFGIVSSCELDRLHKQLQLDCYSPQAARGILISKSDGNSRTVGIYTVRDRIVQRALLQRLYPVLDSALSDRSHAYHLGRSVKTAITQALSYCDRGVWFVKTDIQQFFERLSWALVMSCLESLNLPPDLLFLIEQQMKVDLILRGQRVNLQRGVLQGGVLSGALANLYLHEFDRYFQTKSLGYVRYGDDLLLICASYAKALQTLSMVADRLQTLYLAPQPSKTAIHAFQEQFNFLGYRFCEGQAEQILLPHRPDRTNDLNKSPRRSVPPSRRALLSGYPQADVELRTQDYWRTPMSTLYITDQGALLRVDHQKFKVLHQQQTRCEVPINHVSHVFLFGCCNVSHAAASLALQRKIPVIYLSRQGRYFGRLETSGQAEIGYLTQQVQKSLDPVFQLQIAKAIVLGKLHNSRILLQRLQRRHPSDEAERKIQFLNLVQDQAALAKTVESLRGYEGHGAGLYFQGFSSLLSDRDFVFEKRTTRPPKNPINSLLSLGYTLLHHLLHSQVQIVGLHTHFGHLHIPRKNHPALVMDLIEEFRAPIVDSLVAYLINSHIFSPQDFSHPDQKGGVYLESQGLKKFLKHWEDKLQTEVTHPHTGFKVSYRRCLELQVWEYIYCLMGERPTYRPMTWEK